MKRAVTFEQVKNLTATFPFQPSVDEVDSLWMYYCASCTEEEDCDEMSGDDQIEALEEAYHFRRAGRMMDRRGAWSSSREHNRRFHAMLSKWHSVGA